MQEEAGRGPTCLMAMAYIFPFFNVHASSTIFLLHLSFFLSVFALFDLHGGDFWAEIDLRILIGGAYCTCLMDTSAISIEYMFTIFMQKGITSNETPIIN